MPREHPRGCSLSSCLAFLLFVSGVSSCPALAESMNVCHYPQRVSVFPEENASHVAEIVTSLVARKPQRSIASSRPSPTGTIEVRRSLDSRRSLQRLRIVTTAISRRAGSATLPPMRAWARINKPPGRSMRSATAVDDTGATSSNTRLRKVRAGTVLCF